VGPLTREMERRGIISCKNTVMVSLIIAMLCSKYNILDLSAPSAEMEAELISIYAHITALSHNIKTAPSFIKSALQNIPQDGNLILYNKVRVKSQLSLSQEPLLNWVKLNPDNTFADQLIPIFVVNGKPYNPTDTRGIISHYFILKFKNNIAYILGSYGDQFMQSRLKERHIKFTKFLGIIDAFNKRFNGVLSENYTRKIIAFTMHYFFKGQPDITYYKDSNDENPGPPTARARSDVICEAASDYTTGNYIFVYDPYYVTALSDFCFGEQVPLVVFEPTDTQGLEHELGGSKTRKLKRHKII